MRWMALALLGLFGCGLTLDLTPPEDGAVSPPPDGGLPDAPADAAPDAPACDSDADCADLAVGECVSRCLPSGVCLLPDRDGDGVGPGCADERDCDDNDPDLGTEGVRACDPGDGMCSDGATQSCVDGVLGACTPARTPALDDATCDGIDDDCDGEPDEDAADFPVGTGACGAVYECMDGAWVAATPPPASGPDLCTPSGETPVDDDCDGSIDEDCAPEVGDCVFVSPFPLSPAPADLSMATNPAMGVGSVDEALGLIATHAAAPSRICLLADGTRPGACGSIRYIVTDTLPGGLTVRGNLVWTGPGGDVLPCDADDRTVLLPPSGGLQVVPATGAPPDAPVTLVDLAVDFPQTGTPTAVDVQPGAALVLAQVNIRSPGPVSGDDRTSRGVQVQTGGSLLATASRIEGGAGTEAYGIDAKDAEVILLNSCGSSTCTPSCAGERPAVRGGTASTSGAAIHSEGGTLTVSRYAVCQGPGPTGIDADGAELTVVDSVVEVAGRGETLQGLHLRGCSAGGPEHFIGGSTLAMQALDRGEPGDSVAVRVESGCDVGLFRNPRVVGGASGVFGTAVGLSCDGTCALVGNTILGLAAGASADSAVAVHGDRRGTLVLQGNTLQGSASAGAADAAGVAMEGTAGGFARNHLSGGCATNSATGALVERGAVRMESNVLVGAACEAGPPTFALGLAVDGGQVDVNGNTATGGVTSAGECAASGLVTDARSDDDRAAFRNNVFSGGPGCEDSVAVFAATLPQVFDHNGLTHGIFYGGDGTAYASAGALLRLDSRYLANVFTDAPGFLGYPDDLHIRASSPFAGAGTRAGAPAEDFDGTPRPRRPSMGAFEP